MKKILFVILVFVVIDIIQAQTYKVENFKFQTPTVSGLPSDNIPIIIGKIDCETLFVFYGHQDTVVCLEGGFAMNLLVVRRNKIIFNERVDYATYARDGGSRAYDTSFGFFEFPIKNEYGFYTDKYENKKGISYFSFREFKFPFLND